MWLPWQQVPTATGHFPSVCDILESLHIQGDRYLFNVKCVKLSARVVLICWWSYLNLVGHTNSCFCVLWYLLLFSWTGAEFHSVSCWRESFKVLCVSFKVMCVTMNVSQQCCGKWQNLLVLDPVKELHDKVLSKADVIQAMGEIQLWEPQCLCFMKSRWDCWSSPATSSPFH